MKFRVDRDVLADAVAWAARSLPVRPSVPVLAGLLIEASDEGLVLSTFDYETSARATLHADVGDEGRRPGQRPAARRHLPQPAGQAGRDGARRLPGLADLRFGAVQPADDAGRGLPDPARHAGRDRHRPSEVFAHAVAQAVTAAGRDDMLPVLTGVRIEIDGSTISMLATDRFRLSHRELSWNPAPPTTRSRRWCRRKVLGDTAKSLTGGSEVTIALATRAARARASSASRARPPAAPGVRPPGCSTASSPRSAACSRAST